jgi:hypothetical protein
MSMDERQRRVGLNEALFREVNERIEDLNRAFGELTDRMSVVCECGDARCHERLDVPIPEYERVRADATTFVLVPGHEDPTVETVVDRREDYFVVRKEGDEVERLAVETDPRG